MTGLTDTDRNFIETADIEELRRSLDFANSQNDLEYAKAIAVEILKRKKSGDAGR